MAVAMATLFVVALTIPEAWNDAEGGLFGPLVLVVAYLIVRCVHLPVYALAARGDPGLRRQLEISRVPTVAGAVLIVAGVLLGGNCRRCSAPAPSPWTGAASTSPRERATGASTARPTGPSATACSSSRYR